MMLRSFTKEINMSSPKMDCGIAYQSILFFHVSFTDSHIIAMIPVTMRNKCSPVKMLSKL